MTHVANPGRPMPWPAVRRSQLRARYCMAEDGRPMVVLNDDAYVFNDVEFTLPRLRALASALMQIADERQARHDERPAHARALITYLVEWQG